jgi:hypothetical protein
VSDPLPVASPQGYAIGGLGTSSQQVLGAAGASREKLEFYNPNGGAAVWIAAAPLVAVPHGAGSILVLPGGPLTISGRNVTCAWNACADMAGQNLTILEYLQ